MAEFAVVAVTGVHILGAAAAMAAKKKSQQKEALEFDPKESAKKLVKRMDRLIQQQSEGHDAKVPGEIPSSLPPLPVFNEDTGEPQTPTFTSVGAFLSAVAKVPSYGMYKKIAEVAGVSGSNRPNGLLLLNGVQLQDIVPSKTSRHWTVQGYLSCCIGYTTKLPGIDVRGYACLSVCLSVILCQAGD